MNTTGIRWVASDNSVTRFSELSLEEIIAATRKLRQRAAEQSDIRQTQFAERANTARLKCFELQKQIYAASEYIQIAIEKSVITQDQCSKWENIFTGFDVGDGMESELQEYTQDAQNAVQWLRHRIDLNQELSSETEWMKYYILGAERSPKARNVWKFEAKRADAELNEFVERNKQNENKQRELARQTRANASGARKLRVPFHEDPGAQQNAITHAPNVRLTEDEEAFLKQLDI